MWTDERKVPDASALPGNYIVPQIDSLRKKYIIHLLKLIDHIIT